MFPPVEITSWGRRPRMLSLGRTQVNTRTSRTLFSNQSKISNTRGRAMSHTTKHDVPTNVPANEKSREATNTAIVGHFGDKNNFVHVNLRGHHSTQHLGEKMKDEKRVSCRRSQMYNMRPILSTEPPKSTTVTSGNGVTVKLRRFQNTLPEDRNAFVASRCIHPMGDKHHHLDYRGRKGQINPCRVFAYQRQEPPKCSTSWDL